MKRFAFGAAILTASLMGAASSVAFAADDNYSVNGGQGNTTVKSPDVPVKTNNTTTTTTSQPNTSQPTTQQLYDSSKQGGKSNYDVNQSQQH